MTLDMMMDFCSIVRSMMIVPEKGKRSECESDRKSAARLESCDHVD